MTKKTYEDGYLDALLSIKKIVDEKLDGYEYALGEMMSGQQRDYWRSKGFTEEESWEMPF